MKLTTYIILGLCLILVLSCSLNAKSKRKQVVEEKTPVELAVDNAQEAETAFSENNYPLSIEKFNTAIDFYKQALPTAPEADSIQIRLFKLNMNVAKVHYAYALSLSDQMLYDDSIMEYEQAIQLYKSLKDQATPEDDIDNILIGLYKNVAIGSKDAGEFFKAIDYFDLYLDAHPEDEAVLLTKFEIYRDDLKDEAQAFEVFKEYAVRKNDFNAYHKLGDLYRDKNEINDAVYWYEKADSIKTDSNVLQKLGTLYRSPTQQEWEKSNRCLELFVTMKPDLEELKTAYKLIADNYKNLKNKAKAVEYFEMYSDFEYDENISLYICSYYFDTKNNAKALFWSNKILENNPDNPGAILFRAITKYNMNDMKGAKADFERIANDAKYGKTAQQYLKIIK